MKKLLIISLLLMFVLGSVVASANDTYTLTWGSIEAVGGIQYKTMQWLKEEIKERSNGRLKIDYHPANQLGSTTEQMDSITAGTIDGMNLGCNLMGRMGELWMIDSLPFMFQGPEHRKTFNNSKLNKERKEKLLEKFGIRVIANNWYRTPHVLVTTKPIRNLEDLKDLKMRVPESRGQYIGWEELGTNPTTISWGEVYLALKQGVAEGVSVPFEMIPETEFHEVAPYITMLRTEFSYEVVMINEQTYQKLPKDLKGILIEVFEEAGNKYTELSRQKQDNTLEQLTKEDAQILFLNNEPFRKKVTKNLPHRLDKQGILEKEIWEKVENLTE